MMTNILTIDLVSNILLAFQLGSYLTIQYYEVIEDLVNPNYTKRHILNLILVSAYVCTVFKNLKQNTYKTNTIKISCPMFNWMYYLRYLKNLILAHTLISILFYKYLTISILFNFTLIMFYGWLFIIYLFLSGRPEGGVPTPMVIGISILILIITLVSGFNGWMSYEVMFSNLLEDWSSWQFDILIILSGIFVLSTIIAFIFLKTGWNDILSKFIRVYLIEQVAIASCIFSLVYYNIYIRMFIYTVLSILLVSDRLYSCCLNIPAIPIIPKAPPLPVIPLNIVDEVTPKAIGIANKSYNP